jgi:hypothetical protein
MKALLTLALLTVSLVLTGCEAYVVDRGPTVYPAYSHRAYYHRPTVVAYHNDDRYYNDGYYDAGYYGSRRTVRSHYVAPTRIVYLSDHRGRYYVSRGRRVYVR